MDVEVEERKEDVGVQVPESDWVGPLCPATSLSWGWGGEVDWGVGGDNELEVMVGHDVFDMLGIFEFLCGQGKHPGGGSGVCERNLGRGRAEMSLRECWAVLVSG